MSISKWVLLGSNEVGHAVTRLRSLTLLGSPTLRTGYVRLLWWECAGAMVICHMSLWCFPYLCYLCVYLSILLQARFLVNHTSQWIICWEKRNSADIFHIDDWIRVSSPAPGISMDLGFIWDRLKVCVQGAFEFINRNVFEVSDALGHNVLHLAPQVCCL